MARAAARPAPRAISAIARAFSAAPSGAASSWRQGPPEALRRCSARARPSGRGAACGRGCRAGSGRAPRPARPNIRRSTSGLSGPWSVRSPSWSRNSPSASRPGAAWSKAVASPCTSPTTRRPAKPRAEVRPHGGGGQRRRSAAASSQAAPRARRRPPAPGRGPRPGRRPAAGSPARASRPAAASTRVRRLPGAVQVPVGQPAPAPAPSGGHRRRRGRTSRPAAPG